MCFARWFDRVRSRRRYDIGNAGRDAAVAGGKIRLAVTLFATGLLGVAFEMIVVRLAAQVMQDTIYTFAGLLAAYLLAPRRVG